MLLFKAVSFVVTVVLTMLVFRQLHMLMQQFSAARAKAMVRPQQPPKAAIRLRQDPRTGIYYPES